MHAFLETPIWLIKLNYNLTPVFTRFERFQIDCRNNKLKVINLSSRKDSVNEPIKTRGGRSVNSSIRRKRCARELQLV